MKAEYDYEKIRVIASVFVLVWVPIYMYYLFVVFEANSDAFILYLVLVPQVFLALQSLYLYLRPDSSMAQSLIPIFKVVAGFIVAFFGMSMALGSFYIMFVGGWGALGGIILLFIIGLMGLGPATVLSLAYLYSL